MGTWTAIYIETADLEKTISVVEEIANSKEKTEGSFPNDLQRNYLFGSSSTPNYLVVGKTQDDWVTIRHNSLGKLENWGKWLSEKLDSQVIITLADNTSDGYYFALYKGGIIKREIETCYSEDFDMVNKGIPFEFENEKPGERHDWNGVVSYIFDFDSIVRYCKYFGLTIQTDYQNVTWTILKGGQEQTKIKEIVNKFIETPRKPWWKFW